MDAEQNQEVLDLPLETGIETAPGSKLEIPGEPLELLTESEKPPEETQEDESPKKSPEKVVASKLTEPEKSPEKPEADRSPEKTSDPVTGCPIQPEDIQNLDLEQQPMKTPEPLPLDEPLAENNIEGMPEKFGELVPGVVPQSEQTLPDPVTQSQFEEVKQICQEKEVPEQPEKQADIQMVTKVEPEMQSEPEIVKEVVKEVEAVQVEPENPEKILEVESEKPTDVEEGAAAKPAEAQTVDEVVTEKPVEIETVKESAAEKPVEAQTVDEVVTEKPVEIETVKESAAEKPVEAQTVDEVVTEKPVEIETAKEGATEKPVEAETVKEVEGEKPAEAETVKEEVVVEESTAEGDVENVEQQEAELVKEEEPVPAPGSLSFALLEQEQTMATLRTSRTFIILKGLPGSGKSLLARAIADSYKDLCTVFSADDHGVKPESPEASTDAYKALDEAVVAYCSAGTAASMVVVDDTNHTHGRLARLGELAEQHRLVAMFLEPRTEWSRDLPQLAKKSQRGLEEAQIKAMKDPLEETTLPLFFGWFLLHGIQDKVRCMSMDFLKTLDTLEAFQKHLTDFTGEAGKEVDLEQYFQTKGDLHCTTKFCDYGKAEGAKEYAENPAVKELYGCAFELSLSALFVTPRTVGARVCLSADQLVLWPADTTEKDAESDVPSVAPLPAGSRAHITLGCAEGVQPLQTGLDLLEILALQQEGQQGELVEEMELGSLAYYGKGRWLLNLREPVAAQACFSSRYHPKKEEQAKKECEKKKKKCTIL